MAHRVLIEPTLGRGGAQGGEEVRQSFAMIWAPPVLYWPGVLLPPIVERVPLVQADGIRGAPERPPLQKQHRLTFGHKLNGSYGTSKASAYDNRIKRHFASGAGLFL